MDVIDIESGIDLGKKIIAKRTAENRSGCAQLEEITL